MDIEAFFKKNPDVKKWMKWSGAVVVAIWIVREIFMMTMFHSIFGFVTGGINSQEAAMKSMEQRAEEHMQNVENGMRGVANGIQAGAEEMNQKLEKLKKDFEKAAEVEESLKHGLEDLEKASDETTKYMFEKIEQDAKESEILSKKFIDSWFVEYEKKKKKQRLQDKKDWEAKRKKTLQETGFLLPSYEEPFWSKS